MLAVLVELARMVGKAGDVIGVEPDQHARAAAEEEISAAGVGNARVVDGTGTQTGLPARSCDTVMGRNLLYHVGRDAPLLVEHCASLLRAGGHLYLVDTNMEAVRVDPADAHPLVLDLIARHNRFQRDRGCNVDIGPRLESLLTGVSRANPDRSSSAGRAGSAGCVGRTDA